MTKGIAIFLILFLTITVTPSQGKQASKTTGQPMKKYVTEQATFVLYMPEGWKASEGMQGNFKTLFVTDPSGHSSFVVGSVDVLTPQSGVRVPGAIISNYLPPHQAMQFLAGRQGFATHMQFIQVIPRQDLAQQSGQGAGPVGVEELIYTFNAQGRRCKGYSFGVSFGSRLNLNWKFWHISVGAPIEQFDAFVQNFVAMVQSYKINEQFAQNYIAQGSARLRQMQQDTARRVARNAQEIRQMMQAAYDGRQRSMDYIDYQRTNYIRGTSDWISQMEGGTIYQSDRWGTKNTATGDYYEGQTYNYFNFTGKNPKYNEQMQEINSRALYEIYKKGTP